MTVHGAWRVRALQLACAACDRAGCTPAARRSDAASRSSASTTPAPTPTSGTPTSSTRRSSPRSSGWTLKTTNSQNDVAKLTANVQTFISQGVKGIAMAPQDTAAIAPTLQQLEAKKIPVVTIDTRPDSGNVFMVVRADNRAYGEKACQFLGTKLGGKGKVVMLAGRPGLDQRPRPHRGVQRLHEEELPRHQGVRRGHQLGRRARRAEAADAT